jgi:choline dehydrogenase-like flavoprotein
MRLELSALGEDDHFDCCIVGTGPAGVTCALALADAGKRVALLEGGGEDWSEWSQGLYRGEVEGDPYFDLAASRLRYFGGTSNHWDGWCRTLDAVDFQAKGSREITRWPISRPDLDPHLAKAAEILELPPLHDDKPLAGGGFKRVHFVASPPVRFGEKYRDRLVADRRITLVFDANLVGLETNGAAISAAKVAGSDGQRRGVRADRYVLAAGGIENSRLLLWCNAQAGGQIVKDARTLGRYWMDHPHFQLGEAILEDEFAHHPGENEHYAFFAPTARTIAQSGILNCGLRLQFTIYEESAQMVADMACVAPDLGSWFFSQLGATLICGAIVHAAWEQEPRAENRIELSEARDALGMPRPKLFWRKSAADLHTVQTVAFGFGAYLARTGTGRLRLEPWVLGEADYPDDDQLAGQHQMGGTRMAATPDQGVVDANCKVFGQSNLYLAGSSVFPSSGHANPTLTIVQLALRLAEHLMGLS